MRQALTVVALCILFIAYVPEGSLAKGKHLVTLGGAQIVNGEIVQAPARI